VRPEGYRRATYDLHLHSSRSDGRFSPQEVLAKAASSGLDVIALTDHDLTGGIAPGEHVVGGRSISVIAGAELTGTHEGREFHLLVYFPGEPPPEFIALCQSQTQARAQRYDAAVQNMGLSGVELAPPEAHTGELALTRHHLGRAVVRAGHAATVGDAITKFATRENVPAVSMPFVSCIERARAAGGVTSWAHPPREALEAHLAEFAAAGLQGLEGIRPGMRREDRVYVKKLAKRYGLFLTGGSDWHGWGGAGDLGLFRIRGEDLVPFLDALAA
jgi:predicted metal-dependent phosphoesterase TrpH